MNSYPFLFQKIEVKIISEPLDRNKFNRRVQNDFSNDPTPTQGTLEGSLRRPLDHLGQSEVDRSRSEPHWGRHSNLLQGRKTSVSPEFAQEIHQPVRLYQVHIFKNIILCFGCMGYSLKYFL